MKQSNKHSIPKGVFDILPNPPSKENIWRTSDHWQYVENLIRDVAQLYGFKEIRTPIFERTELFVRSVGESSDIVTKEMYTFEDKANRSMTLRPEGTAPSIRAFIENGLQNTPPPYKFFYIGPMFRYERPQSGRYRQHHQFGAEAIGSRKPEQDVELIDLLCELYRRLGLKNLTVMINSVGDAACREPYKKALADFLRPNFDQLSPESQTRLSKNVLRILDSKDEKDQKILESSPSILHFLNEECKEHFEKVCSLLNELKIPYIVNSKLVRGLDYYNKTVFEITSGELGAQNTVGAGGRYDGLVSSLGGPDLPAVGFATGIERLLQTMFKQNLAFPPASHPYIFLIPIGDSASRFCFHLLHTLRQADICAEIDMMHKKVSQAFQSALHCQAKYVLVVGDEELKSGLAKLKEIATHQETLIELDKIQTHLMPFAKNKFQIK